MSYTEFDVIRLFSARQKVSHSSTILGIGDDSALIKSETGFDLAVATDTMVEGVHFFHGVNPESLGHKALAVNLSDLAAMGANPHWATLALTLPSIDEKWLLGFCDGFYGLAERHSVELVGGDTTKGPLTITVQVIGSVKHGTAMCRSNANAGDSIYITGYLGDAGLSLKILKGQYADADFRSFDRLHRPSPRLVEGARLKGVASACIDISDGLAADLGHILKASQVGALIFWEKISLSGSLKKYVETTGDWRLPLTAGDDYELCLTVSVDQENELERHLAGLNCSCTRIGVIEEKPGLRILKDSEQVDFTDTGYVHFTESP